MQTHIWNCRNRRAFHYFHCKWLGRHIDQQINSLDSSCLCATEKISCSSKTIRLVSFSAYFHWWFSVTGSSSQSSQQPMLDLPLCLCFSHTSPFYYLRAARQSSYHVLWMSRNIWSREPKVKESFILQHFKFDLIKYLWTLDLWMYFIRNTILNLKSWNFSYFSVRCKRQLL